jgi:gamma-glutamyl hydrolase
LESAGARIVPIPYDSSEEVLEQLFSRISGLFFPGGAVDITVNATELGLLSRGKNSNKFTSSATFLLRKAMQANEKGD